MPADWSARLRAGLRAAPEHRLDFCRFDAALVRPSAAISAQMRASLPPTLKPAAVLVPIIEQTEGPTVLRRFAPGTCAITPGRSVFRAGGWSHRIWMRRRRPCARPKRRPVSRRGWCERSGFLPDHLVRTGFRVTPVVGLLRPHFHLRPLSDEVAEVFELPLATVLHVNNFRSRRRAFRGLELNFWELEYDHKHDLGRDRRHSDQSARVDSGQRWRCFAMSGTAPADPACESLAALLALMRRLRDPQSGCPWDREQSFATIAPYTIEEAYEVADAIGRDDPGRLRDELGDLLFQVVFLSRLGEERGQFDFAAVARGVRDKLVRRHPHVFAAGTAPGQLPGSVAMSELHTNWEAQKARERAAAGAQGALSDVPLALPALTRAAKLGARARRVGFDWDAAEGVRRKVDEELAEIDEALGHGRRAAVAAEIGDLLFTVANWARHLQVDAEAALRAAGVRFETRFAHMEGAAAAQGSSLSQLDARQREELWERANRPKFATLGAIQPGFRASSVSSLRGIPFRFHLWVDCADACRAARIDDAKNACLRADWLRGRGRTGAGTGAGNIKAKPGDGPERAGRCARGAVVARTGGQPGAEAHWRRVLLAKLGELARTDDLHGARDVADQ